MALQDRTLANTMAKMNLEATRRRNTQAALQAMRQPRGAGELPVWAQGGPMMGSMPAAPGWLQRASDWLRDPGYRRESVVPGAALVDYARTVAEGGRPGAMETAGAALDLPLPGMKGAAATLAAIPVLGLGTRVKPSVLSRGVHYSHEPGLSTVDPAFAGEGLDMVRRAQEARGGSARPRESFFYEEGSELAGRPEIGLGANEYRTRQPVEVYDLNKDPLGLMAKQKQAWAEKSKGKPWMGEMPGTEARENVLRELKDLGYTGYIDRRKNVFATFEPVDVRPAETGVRAYKEGVDVLSSLPTTPQPRTRGPDYLRAFERRKNKGQMEYVGAPPGVTAPRHIESRVEDYARRIEDALDAGIPPGYFYEEGSRILGQTARTPEAAEQFAQLMGVTSSESPVASNFNWSMEGMEQSLMGLPVKTGLRPANMVPKIESIMAGGDPGLGIKTGRYATGLSGGRAKGEEVLAPNDLWEARSVGYNMDPVIDPITGESKKRGGLSATEARFVDRVRQEAIRRVNEKRGLNLTQLQGQELNWLGARTRGTKGPDAPITIDEARDTVQGALAARTMQHSWETAPGAAAQHLENMTPEQFDDYRRRMEGAVLTPGGRDRFIDASGGQFQLPAFRGPGLWAGEVTPGVQSRSVVAATGSEGLHPASEARIKGGESMRALALGQEAYAGHMLTPSGGKGPQDVLAVKTGGVVDDQTALNVQGALDQTFGPGNTSVVPTPNGFNILQTTPPEEPIPNFTRRMRKFSEEQLPGLTGTNDLQAAGGRYGSTGFYEELPWEKGQATATVLKTLGAAPGLERQADSPGTRQLMGDVARVYNRMKDRGIMPNEKLLNVLKVWEKEGLTGVRRLVQQGVAPVAILGILTAQGLQEPAAGGQNGAPAGSGLPELGV